MDCASSSGMTLVGHWSDTGLKPVGNVSDPRISQPVPDPTHPLLSGTMVAMSQTPLMSAMRHPTITVFVNRSTLVRRCGARRAARAVATINNPSGMMPDRSNNQIGIVGRLGCRATISSGRDMPGGQIGVPRDDLVGERH